MDIENVLNSGSRFSMTGYGVKATADSRNFTESVYETERVDTYKEYLESRYGNVMIQSVGKDQRSMDSLGASTSGLGNVAIAPNILEEMANNPKKAAYYEGKIQNYFDSVPRYQAELSAMGHEIHSCGIVIHPDGTVTHYICGDLKPEVRAKIEARIKAEDEEKAKRRKQYLEQGQEAAEQRRQIWETYYQKQAAAVLHNQKMDSNIYIASQPQVMSSAVLAYESTIHVFGNNVI